MEQMLLLVQISAERLIKRQEERCMNGKSVKRFLAGLMAFAVAFTSIDITGLAAAGTNGGSGDTWESTAAKVVAGYYYSDDENATAILSSDAVSAGESYSVKKPESGTGLAVVDAQNHKVYAKNYEDNGLTWKPVSAVLADNDGKTSNVELTEEKATYDGEDYDAASEAFSFEAASYTATVTYKLSVSIGETEQKRLLAIPAVLTEAVQNLRQMDYTMQQNLGTIETAVQGLHNYEAKIADEAAVAAIESLYDEMTANNNELQLSTLARAAVDAGTSLSFALEQGAAVKQYVASTYDALYQLQESDALNRLIENAGQVLEDEDLLKALQNWNDTLDALVGEDGSLKKLKDSPWRILDAEKSDLFAGDDVSELNELVQSAADNGIEEKSYTTASIPAAEATIRINVASGSVHVKVTAQTAPAEALELNTLPENPSDTKTLEAKEETLAFASGTSKTDVLKKIEESALESKALKAWKDAGYDLSIEAGYEKTADDSQIPERISETTDVMYTIAYAPKTVTITVKEDGEADIEKQVYYGSKIRLSEANEATESYDYVVDGIYYNQGDEILVTEDTEIERTAGAAKTTERITSLLAKDAAYGFTEDEQSMLESSAWKSDSLSLRYPAESAAGKVSEGEGDTYSVTLAGSYDSGVEGLKWVPAGVTVTGTDGTEKNVTASAPDENGYVTYTWSGDYKKAEVLYRLDLSGKYDGAAFANLPNTVATEVKAQAEALNSGSEGSVDAKYIYDKLESVKNLMSTTTLGLVQSKMKTQEGKAAVDTILKRESEGGAWNVKEPALYTYLSTCSLGKWSVSSYYISGLAEKMQKQAALLSQCLTVIINDPGFDAALKSAEDDLGMENATQKGDTIRRLAAELGTLADKFQPANSALDVTSSSFAALIDAAQSAETKEHTGSHFTVSSTVRLESDGYGSTTVTVQAADARAQQVYEYTFDPQEETAGHYMTEADKTALERVIAGLESKVGITDQNKAYYDRAVYLNGKDGALDTGTRMSRTITVKYTPKTYVVKADGEVIGRFVYGSGMGVSLAPYSTDTAADSYYRYAIAGETIDVMNGDTSVFYPFTEEALGTYFRTDSQGQNSYTITRETVVKKWEDLDAFVDSVNTELQNNNVAVALVPVKKNGSQEYDSLVLRIVPDEKLTGKDGLEDLLTAVASAVAKISYSYIGFGKDGSEFPFLYNEDGLKAAPQALIDLMLNSDLNSTKVLSLIGEDGKIQNPLTVKEGCTAETAGILKEGESLGGSFVSAELHVGEAKDTYDSVPLYVTVANDNGEGGSFLKNLRNVAKAAQDNNVKLALENGSVQLGGTLTDKAYSVYMAVMLMLGQVNLDEFNDATLAQHVSYLSDELQKVLNENPDADWEMIQNTLKKADVNADLEPYSSLIDKAIGTIRNILNGTGNVTLTKSENEAAGSYGFTLSYDMSDRLSDIKGGETLKDLLASTAISVSAEAQILNYNDEYQALVIDLGQTGFRKISFTKDLQAALNGAQGDTLAVLLTDISAADTTLTIGQRTVLNLNGKTLTVGRIQADKALRVVDGSTMNGTAGTVNGDLEGNIRLAAGYYGDLTLGSKDMVQQGYVLEDGQVKNAYYDIEKAENGDVTVTVKTDKLAELADGNLQTLGIEAVSNILFNVYGNAKMTVNGKNIYSVKIENLIDKDTTLDGLVNDILQSVDTEGASWAGSELVRLFTDYDKLAEALTDAEQPIAAYTYTTAPWALAAQKFEDADGNAYLGLGIGQGEESAEATVTVRFDKADKDLAAMFRDLQDVLKVTNRGLTLKNLSYTDGKFQWDAAADLDVTAELAGNTAASRYTEVIAVLLAAQKTGDEQNAFVEAIRSYEAGSSAEALKEKIDAATFGELIAAMKAAKEKTFQEMTEELGLSQVLTEAKALEQKYQTILQITYGLTGAADRLVGDKNKVQELYAKTFASIEDAFGSYGGTLSARDGAVKLAIRMNLFNEEYNSSVQEVIDLINQIELPITEENRESQIEKIIAAREAYDALTDEEKAMVGNYNRLQEAEDAYRDLGLWTAAIPDQIYTGTAIKPEVRVYEGATRLKEKTDYTVSYIYNTNAGTVPETLDSTTSYQKLKAPAAVIKFKKNYTGILYEYFNIEQIDLSRWDDEAYCESVGLEIRDVNLAVNAKGKEQLGKPALYLNGRKVSTTQYTLSYPDNAPEKNLPNAYKGAGDWDIQINAVAGKNFTGTGHATQHMASTLMSKASVDKIPTQTYGVTNWNAEQGTVEPELVVKYNKTILTKGKDYTVTYTKNDRIGTATATITGTEQYGEAVSFTGTKKVTFKIVGTALKSSQFALNIKSKTYTGSEIELAKDEDYTVAAGLEEGRDYEVSYLKNINKGTAAIVFKGINAYSGTIKKTFKITARTLDEDMLQAENITVAYEKSGVKPSNLIVVRYGDMVLKEGKDYTITWKNNTAVADTTSSKAPQYRIVGKGNFTGTLAWQKFTIKPAELDGQVTIKANDVIYKAGKKNNFATTVTLTDVNGKKLTAGRDYLKTYTYYVDGEEQPLTAGTFQTLDDRANEIWMKVVVTGTGSYTGTLEAEYRITRYRMSSIKVTKIEQFVVYDRQEKAITTYATYGNYPLKEGVDYEVVYGKNVFAGTATATLTALPGSAFTGTKKVVFTIKPVHAWSALTEKSSTETQKARILFQY